jgi:hypothetical protein
MNDPIATLLFCSEILDKQRFAGFDQNPSGIRDLLYSAIRDAERKIKDLEALTKQATRSTGR